MQQTKAYLGSLFGLFFLLSAQLSFAQFSSQFSNGYYTLGLNAGWSYQSSDVRANLKGFGLGLTLGKSLYYQPGSAIAFDLRGRFLYARQYGLDPFRSFDIESNTALNGTGNLDYTQYPNDLNEPRGFVYQNHRTDVAELGIEAVLTANRLREQTGILASIYGGVGLDWYRARVDQSDALGQAYYQDYSQISAEASKGTTLRTLKNEILDGTYETNADDFENYGKLGIMPSVGIELGYHLTPGFALTVGHRLTFAGTDLLDGHQWKDNTNDLYHYTALGMQWTLPAGKARTKGVKPNITLIEPNRNPSYTSSPNAFLRARIQHVNSTADITLHLNGQPVNFTFNDEILYTSFRLRAGQNDLVIRAQNIHGSDRELVVIHYQTGTVVTPPGPPPPPTPIPSTGLQPSVQITRPSATPYTTDQQQYRVEAAIKQVTDKSDIEFRVNGRRIYDFNWNGSVLSSTLALENGNNSVQVTAKNQRGTASDQATIIFQSAQPTVQGPKVTITRPSSSSATVGQSSYLLKAEVLRVDNKSDISFTINNQAIYDFSFNAKTGSISKTISLTPGKNDIAISATNAGGTAKDQVVIQYNKPVTQQTKPPVVDINRPADNSRTDQYNQRIEATIKEVSSKSDITFRLNGQGMTNFTFNPSTDRFTADIVLREGANQIQITAQNQDGQDMESINVIYSKKRAPVVTITTPSSSSTVSNSSAATLKAELLHVSAKSDVRLTLNGQPISNFSFGNERLTANLTLKQGLNTIQVRGSNDAGSDQASVQITYRPNTPPTVDIQKPEDNSSVSSARLNLTAQTTNVSNQNEVKVYLNNQPVNFSFSNNLIKATLTINKGSNKIRINVNNSDGSDQDEVTVTLIPTVPAIKRPIVRFKNPVKPGQEVTTEQGRITAEVLHVDGKESIELRLNDKVVKDFSYDPKSKLLNLSTTWIEGDNTIVIYANNQAGQERAATNIIYSPTPTTPSGPKPKITLINLSQPTINPFNPSVGTTTLALSIKNVKRKDQIDFRINGEPFTDFTFNTRTGRLDAQLVLQRGDNTLDITAENQNGSTTFTKAVNF